MKFGEDILLLATDVDGTLLGRNENLSDRTVTAVSAAADVGVRVVLVTGRPPRWADPVAAQIPRHPLAICSNGALIYDTEGQRVVTESPISPDISSKVVEVLRFELKQAAFSVEAGLTYGQEAHYRNQWPLPPDAIIADAEELVRRPIAKLCVRHSEDGEHWELVERARRVVGDLVEVSSSGPRAPIEIASLGVNKAFALDTLATELGIGPAQVIAFGDMPNDLPMLAWAGTSVAPANAHPDVLAAVDHVTGDCDDDGVAAFIEGLLA